MRRHLLGIIALLLLISGASMLWSVGLADDRASMAASICIRAGLVLGAVWLAFPQVVQLLSKAPPWLIASVCLGGLIVIARPRAILFVLPVLLAMGLVQFAGWLFTPLPAKKKRRRRRVASEQQPH